VLALVSSPVLAQSAKDAKAVAARAERDARQRRYEAAIQGYLQAWELGRDPLHFYNVSVIYLARLKDPVKAWEYADRYEKAATAEADLRDAREWKARVEAELSKTHGRVRVFLEPVDGTAWLDRKEEPARIRDSAVWAVPGPHRILAEGPGCEPAGFDIAVEAGKTASVVAKLTPWRPAEARGPSEPIPASERGPVLRPERIVSAGVRAGTPVQTWAWAALGSGAGLAAVGTVLYVLARRELSSAGDLDRPGATEADAYNRTYDAKVKRGKALGYSAYAAWGLGAALVGTGIGLFFAPRSGAAVLPSGPGDAGVTVRVGF
jgi:hypothetical protein